MAWIEFHATRIKKLKKFHDFRKAVGWSVHETLGFLGDWWGQTVDVCETGEVTGWNAEYLSELTGIGPQVSSKVWDALVEWGWIDKTAEGKLLVHDWPDWAGRFLRGRYSDNRARLVEIWTLHGRSYGEKKIPDKLPTSSLSEPDTTVPNLTVPNLTTKKHLFVPAPGASGLAERLKEWILKNNPNAKLPQKLDGWIRDADLLLRVDKRPLKDSEILLDWCQTDPFWRINILSIGKFREKYDQLTMKMNSKPGGKPNVGDAKPSPKNFAGVGY